MSRPSIPAPDPERLVALAEGLAAADYRVAALAALWGEQANAALQREDAVPARRALAALPQALPVATLARLFLLAEAVPEAVVAAALPGLGTAGLVALGLAEALPIDGASEPRLRALVDLRPYAFEDAAGSGEWWIASDPGERAVGGALPEDHVLGVGGASATLAGSTLQRSAGSVLDLGAGCGIQALHAARWAERVVATDLSARALDYARFNAALNGAGASGGALAPIEFRLGSLYAPVEGERFDRIVTNPPFVITPRGPGVPAYEYRDGGLEGDALTAAVVAGAAGHLAPGGIAQLLGNWEYREGHADPALADGLERAAGWARAAGLEHWIVERERLDAAEYAETWIRDGGLRPGDAGYEPLLEAWLADFERRGVTGVGFGLVLLRRPAAPGAASPRRLAIAERLTHPAPGSHAMALDAGLAAHDALTGLDDAALGRLRLRVADDVTEERHHLPGQEHPAVILLRQGGGFGRTRLVGTAEAALVGACDGELELGAIIAALADLLEADAVELAPRLLAAVRELAPEGFLLVD